jgi:mRNA interferase RelE/StbE
MYQVEFTREAEEDLSGLSKTIAQRIIKKIRWLAENFEILTPDAPAKRLGQKRV